MLIYLRLLLWCPHFTRTEANCRLPFLVRSVSVRARARAFRAPFRLQALAETNKIARASTGPNKAIEPRQCASVSCDESLHATTSFSKGAENYLCVKQANGAQSNTIAIVYASVCVRAHLPKVAMELAYLVRRTFVPIRYSTAINHYYSRWEREAECGTEYGLLVFLFDCCCDVLGTKQEMRFFLFRALSPREPVEASADHLGQRSSDRS